MAAAAVPIVESKAFRRRPDPCVALVVALDQGHGAGGQAAGQVGHGAGVLSCVALISWRDPVHCASGWRSWRLVDAGA
jgi:hypothetical protein